MAERDSLACLLLPASGEELRRAVALVDQAVATGPKFSPDNAYLLFIRGLAEYRQGRPQQAVPLLEESAALLANRAGPRLALAMAQFRSGGPAEARQTLAAAVRAYNWMESQADHPTAWVSHVLRREAEALILPDLPAFLRGEYRAAGQRRAPGAGGDLSVPGPLPYRGAVIRRGLRGRSGPGRQLDHGVPLPVDAKRNPSTSESSPSTRKPVTSRPAAPPWPGAGWGGMGPGSAGPSGRAGASRRARGCGPTWPCGGRRWTAVPSRTSLSPGGC